MFCLSLLGLDHNRIHKTMQMTPSRKNSKSFFLLTSFLFLPLHPNRTCIPRNPFLFSFNYILPQEVRGELECVVYQLSKCAVSFNKSLSTRFIVLL